MDNFHAQFLFYVHTQKHYILYIYTYTQTWDIVHENDHFNLNYSSTIWHPLLTSFITL